MPWRLKGAGISVLELVADVLHVVERLRDHEVDAESSRGAGCRPARPSAAGLVRDSVGESWRRCRRSRHAAAGREAARVGALAVAVLELGLGLAGVGLLLLVRVRSSARPK